ncbi:MAG: hypothetical protein HOY76_41980 [Streptomyces sp.]|nr:hypothetical protein [Streptomyces sp.]
MDTGSPAAYANPRANADFARSRIATHLTAARTVPAEATSTQRRHERGPRRAARSRRPKAQPAGGLGRSRPVLPGSGRLPRTGAAEPGTKALTRRPP